MYDMKNLAKFNRFGELAPAAFQGFVAFDAPPSKTAQSRSNTKS